MRAFLFLILAAALLCRSSAQHQSLMDYLERRLLAIEDRITLWHEQTNRYAAELREFKQQATGLAESLEKQGEALRSDLAGLGTRVDRVEREMDYLESQNPLPPCVEVEEQLVEQEVATAKERNKAKHTALLECRDMISSLKAMKILKRSGSPKGVWTKDAVSGSEKIYLFNSTAGDTLLEFDSVRDFAVWPEASRARLIRLPSAWRGTGHVVHGGHIYYVREGRELLVVKCDLRNGSVVDSAVFPVENPMPVYGLNPETHIDLAADGEGLWALYATQESERNICLAKLDPATLDIEQMWDTPCPRENAEAAFVICGTVYVVYNTKLPSRSRVQCVYDVNDMVSSDDAPLIYFPKRYGSHSSLKYNPLERQIYAWDDGYQILYRLVMKEKLEV